LRSQVPFDLTKCSELRRIQLESSYKRPRGAVNRWGNRGLGNTTLNKQKKVIIIIQLSLAVAMKELQEIMSAYL